MGKKLELKNIELTPYDRARYDRQMRIPGFGEEGQKKLKAAKVFLAGAGGLGSPISIYLAVAGVGYIKIVDKDKVELSNLNRQILFWDRDINRFKADVASEKLRAINPYIKVDSVKEAITDENVLDLVGDADIIVDGMDNFPTRFVLNRAAVKLKIPFVHGAIHGLEGRVTTIIPGKTPCLRCIYPEVPPPEVFPVIGVTPALIGLIEATEVIKYLTGIGNLLKNQLLVYDGETMNFQKIRIKRDPRCLDCGKGK